MATIDTLVADLVSWTSASTVTLPNATATECVNEAIRRLTRRHNWRFLQASVDLPIAGGTSGAVQTPPDFVQEVVVYSKDPAQTDPSKALAPISKTQKPAWFGSQSPIANTDAVFPNVASPSSRSVIADARMYYVWAGQLTIVPTPSAQLTVQLDYIKATPDLVPLKTPQDSNPFTLIYPDAVRIGALREAYLFLHEFETAATYETLFANATKEAIDHDNAVAFAGLPQSRGK